MGRQFLLPLSLLCSRVNLSLSVHFSGIFPVNLTLCGSDWVDFPLYLRGTVLVKRCWGFCCTGAHSRGAGTFGTAPSCDLQPEEGTGHPETALVISLADAQLSNSPAPHAELLPAFHSLPLLPQGGRAQRSSASPAWLCSTSLHFHTGL